ncbi:MAG: aminoacetone oxidase family FAD-binding enzyme [Ruminococcus sp.]|nr:aminoacetone oxidase family FAD-binding enzyme [Ruminococcus sp.]
MNINKYDAIIIGGGASGLMCAIAAKQKNNKIKIAIIEKNDRIGKKLLSTGNGRCNLTNYNISADKYFGSGKKLVDKLFEKYTTDYVLDIFKSLGLLSFSDNEGRYYPLCKQASAVLDVLRFACERLNVDIFCNENIKKINRNNSGFMVTTDTQNFNSNKLVIACGSKASPKLGSTASAADYLKNFGLKFTPFSPALCPIKVKSDLLKALKGVRVAGSVALARNNKELKREYGEIQFTDTSLSGICVFNLSLYSQPNDIISIDLLPDYSYYDVITLIKNQKELFGNMPIDCIFTGVLQKRITQILLKMNDIKDFSRLCSSLSDKEIKLIAGTIKKMSFIVASNSNFDASQCAIGGLNADEINPYDMQVKKVKGLYVCGEAIDICGECGGYNLHFAFSSGHLIGENL